MMFDMQVILLEIKVIFYGVLQTVYFSVQTVEKVLQYW